MSINYFTDANVETLVTSVTYEEDAFLTEVIAPRVYMKGDSLSMHGEKQSAWSIGHSAGTVNREQQNKPQVINRGLSIERICEEQTNCTFRCNIREFKTN
jgi:hypothetical protein